MLGNYSALRLRILERLRFRKATRFRVGDRSVYLRPCTTDVDVALSVFGEGEFEFLRRFSNDSRSGAVLDAGAYTGLSALALSDLFPDRTIVCLEPEPENYAVLLKNTNGHPRIIPLNCALGDGSRQEASLLNRGTGSWGFSVVDGPADCAHAEEVGRVPILDIAAVMDRAGVDDFLVAKIDIEGGEYDVLRGDTAVLQRCAVVLVELHDRIRPGCSDAFRDFAVGCEVLPVGFEKMCAIRQ